MRLAAFDDGEEEEEEEEQQPPPQPPVQVAAPERSISAVESEVISEPTWEESTGPGDEPPAAAEVRCRAAGARGWILH